MGNDIKEQIISKITKSITQNIQNDQKASEFIDEVLRLCSGMLEYPSKLKSEEPEQRHINGTVQRVFHRIVKLIDASNILRLAGFEDIWTIPIRSAYEYALDLKKMAKDHTNYPLIIGWNMLGNIATLCDFKKAVNNPEVRPELKMEINSFQETLQSELDILMRKYNLNYEMLEEHWCTSKKPLEKRATFDIADQVGEQESYRLLYSYLSAQCHPNPMSAFAPTTTDFETMVPVILKILEMSLNSYIRWHPQLGPYCGKLKDIERKYYPEL